MHHFSANKAKSTARHITASAIALCWIAGATSAFAAGSAEARTEDVSYSDLNLGTSQGAKVLYARLRSAAETVCLPFQSRNLEKMQLWQRCYDNALDTAVLQINSPVLTAVHSEAAGRARKG